MNDTSLTADGRSSLTRGAVEVWYARLDPRATDIEACAKLLSIEEKERAGRFHRPDLRARFIGRRTILRNLIGRHIADEHGFTLDKDENGKPFVHGQTIRFNMAHRADIVLFAFAHDELGIDLEVCRPDISGLEIARQFFAAEEVAALQRLPLNLRLKGFYRCWTRKEAYLKSTGFGLSRSLRDFAVSCTEEATLLSDEQDPTAPNRWRLINLPQLEQDGFVASLAIEKRSNQAAPKIIWREYPETDWSSHESCAFDLRNAGAQL
jgi:4'-phosphopantetheinyl transferase